jgi:hypothetical protein
MARVMQWTQEEDVPLDAGRVVPLRRAASNAPRSARPQPPQWISLLLRAGVFPVSQDRGTPLPGGGAADAGPTGLDSGVTAAPTGEPAPVVRYGRINRLR